MDENKAPSGIPQAASNPTDPAAAPPSGHPPAGEPIESKSELASIDSPTLAPSMAEMSGAKSGRDAPKIERPSVVEKSEDVKPESPDDTAPGSREIIPLVALTHARASWKFSRITMLAATVLLAAAFGASAGVLGATSIARLVSGEPAPAEVPAALQTTIEQLRSEVAALKAGVDAANRATSAQYSKLVERFDRVERAQSVASKSDAALPKEAIRETTGSVTLPSAAAAPVAPAPVSSGIVPGWAVRDVYRGVAMLQSRMGGMVEVEAGDVLPSLGRIEAIRRQDGRWVVITSKGMITSMR